MSDDYALTKSERLILINQLLILEALHPAERDSLKQHREILEEGYEIFYGDYVFGFVRDEGPSLEECQEVLDTLDMFEAIRHGLLENSRLWKNPYSRFSGYDGNLEPEFMAFAKFTIETLEKYQDFSNKGNDFCNSHIPMREIYLGMLEEWKKLSRAERYILSEDQVEKILNAERVF